MNRVCPSCPHARAVHSMGGMCAGDGTTPCHCVRFLDSPDEPSLDQLVIDALDAGTVQRVATLLLSVPNWHWNYTQTLDAAKWMVQHGRRVDWEVLVRDWHPTPPTDT